MIQVDKYFVLVSRDNYKQVPNSFFVRTGQQSLDFETANGASI